MNEKVFRILEYNKILKLVSDTAICTPAKEKILQLQPACEFNEVEQLQNATAEASSMLVMHGGIPIAPVSNIIPGVRRAKMGGSLSLSELMAVGSVLRVTRQVAKYMGETEKFEILRGIARNLTPVKDLETDIGDAILGEDTLVDNASPELAALRRKMSQLNSKIKDILNDIIHSSAYSKYLQDPIVTMRGDRYVVPVKSEHRGSIQGILHDSSSTGATVFIEPIAVVQINNQLRDLAIAEQREIERIIMEFSERVAQVSEILEINFNSIIELDILFAKAGFCNRNKCIQPNLNNNGYIELKAARHPLIDKSKVVPISLYIGKDFNTLVITGPNTGGKTVTLKTVGLFALMCQTGLHLPTDLGTHMPVFKNIFADIGDEQSIEQSLSTFSSHMVNIVDILNNVEPNTLALFDELGAGTDPDEGAALAIEILEFVRKCGASAVATTHYSELKMYALSTDGVENASCEFDVATLRPTYKLLIGIPGKSNAFAISKRLGLYDTIIENAAARMTAESVRFEDIVSELQQKRESAAQVYDETLRIKAETEKLKAELKKQSGEFKNKRDKIVEDARREAREIIENAKDETAGLMKQFRKLSMESSSKEQLKQMEEIKAQIHQKGSVADKAMQKERRKSGTSVKDIKLGMTVEIISLDDRGTVVSLPNNNGDFQVQIGIMKVKTNVTDVRIIEDTTHIKSGEKVISDRRMVGSKSMNIKTELDLRGFLAYDAIMEVDKFIDDAMLASLPKISIIHGKGTGALRSAIHEHLRKNKLVKSFHLGSFGEGDTGVTIIELK